MATTVDSLILLVPELRAGAVWEPGGAAAPRLPALARFLAVAATAPCGEHEVALAGALGIGCAGDDWPLGSWSRLGEPDAGPVAGPCLRLDPVHLRADRDRVLLIGPQALAIGAQEADAMLGALAPLAAARGWRLEAAPGAGRGLRWYLYPDRWPRLRTRPPHGLAGAAVDPGVVEGPDAPAWRAWLTEAQMVLHAGSWNEAREARGLPAVNALWPWGAGRPASPPVAGTPRLWARDPVAVGLARWCGQEPAEPRSAARVLEAGGGVVVLDQAREALLAGDAPGWQAAAAAVDEHWIRPALAALRRGRLRRLELIPGGGLRHFLGRAGSWRWWRRPVGMAQWLAAKGTGPHGP